MVIDSVRLNKYPKYDAKVNYFIGGCVCRGGGGGEVAARIRKIFFYKESGK